MKTRKLFTILMSSLIFLFVNPNFAYAQVDGCRGVKGADLYACTICAGDGKHAWTALGCLSTDPEEFIADFLRLAIGIGGGATFLFLIYGSFTIVTSGGIPDNIQKGKDIISSAIYGLLFIIFSVVILNLIGVEILAIPGF